MNMDTVIISVYGGVADVEAKPHGIRVIIRDYDNREDMDGNPQEYSEVNYEPDLAIYELAAIEIEREV